MTLHLYYHPFSSYCQKALLAFYERDVPFHPHVVDLGDPRQRAELAAIWPFAKFPVVHDAQAGTVLAEATLIVELIDELGVSGTRLLPRDPNQRRALHLLDRVCDNYLQAPLQKIVGDRLRPADRCDPHGVAEARALLATTYRLLESRVTDGYLAGPDFTLPDCAAAPALFYTARVAPFRADHPRLAAYLDRVLQRPGFRRCIDEARPYRALFPAVESDADWPDGEQRTAF